MGGYAWVTLATNNSYSLGALVLAHSLKKSNTAHKLVVLVTSSVSESMRNQLSTVFDVVKLVDVLDSKDEAHLALMQRPELGITFTKIHCWRLIEFEKCVFLDADTLVVRNCDELFEREEFSAAPDASWPDCFNSGVFVFRPSIETFNKILQFAVENKSFDGGDQGLLNQFFSSWATEDIKKHLPFVYNLTSIGSYAYIPAFKHYGSETRIVHFIGTGKPWLQQLDVATKTVKPSTGYEHLAPLLQQWWDLFCEKVHPNLDKNLESNNEGMSHSPVEACSNSLPIALTDEPQTLRLIPCTLREENVVTEHRLPFIHELIRTHSSGESPQPFVYVQESRRVGSESDWRENFCRTQRTPERIQERHKECTIIDNGIEERDKEEKKEQQPQEEPPPKDPFDYESFVPDESCIKNYLEQNVVTYQPFRVESGEESGGGNPENHEEVITQKESEPLPRFLTIPEDDQRQSGNVDPPVENHETQKQPTPEKETINIINRETPPRETLTKSKSMPFLPLEVTPEPPKPLRSIWKSQPNVNVDPNKKYSMPKLKPIIPKQSSRYILTKIPKVTHYTEFLMSSEYKDPVNLPKDRIGFVATQLHTQRHKRSKTNARAKFGPLPFIPSPEKEKPACKKIRLDHSDDDLYDLTQCKRQSGNKPKPRDVQKKQNGNNVEEILRRLKDFSKDYHHYFGVMPKPRRRTVMCKNALVQASGEGECRTSEAFKAVRTAVCSWSRGTQTSSQREEFRLFRNYVKNQNEASEKGLLMISGRKSTKNARLDPKPAEGEEKTRNDDVIMGKNNGIVNCDHNKGEESTSLIHSGEEEKTVIHSKNQSSFVKEKQPNSVDDVTLFKSNFAALKLQKSELSKDDVSVESEVQSTSEEVEVHPENHPRLTVEESQHDGGVTSAQNNSASTEQQKSEFRKDGLESPIVEKEPFKSQSDESSKPEKNGVIESSIVQSTYLENKELVVHSENHPRLTVEESDDVTATQKNGVSLVQNNIKSPKTSVESSKVQNTRSENEGPVARLENQPSFVVKESQQADDVTAAQKTPLSVQNQGQIMNEKEYVLHSKNQSPLDVRNKQLEDDVTASQNNGVPLKIQVLESPTDRGSVESSTVKLIDPVDDVINGFSEKRFVETNHKDDVVEPQMLDKSEEFRTNVPTGWLENGSHLDSSLENKETFPEQNQTPRDDLKSVHSTPATTPFTSSPALAPELNGNASQQVKNDDKVKKPEEMLCVPDFETPRSSRVTVKTTEEEIKPRKSRSSPKKVHGRCTNNSSDESVRVTGKEELLEEGKDTSGIAGAIAQLSLQAGSEQTPESTAASSAAHQEYLRRQNWETGNIDYMGRDSFDNIWSKICQTLEAKDQEPPTTGGEVKKPSETLVPNVPEFIETLPGKPAPGPVEEDEIIFSKPDSRQSGLTNISEEEEAGGEGVKLSDILGKGKGGGGGDGKGPEVKSGKIEPLVPSSGITEVKPPPLPAEPLPAAKEGKTEPMATSTETKIQPLVICETKIEPLVPLSAITEDKSQTLPAEGSPLTAAVEIKSQPGASEVKPQPMETQPQTAAKEGKTEPTATSTETKTQCPAASETKIEPLVPSSGVTEEKFQPLPAEGSPLPAAAEIKSQPTAAKTEPQTVAKEGKTEPAAISTETKTQSPAVSETKIEPLVPPSDAKPQPQPPSTGPAGTETKPEPTLTPMEVKAQLLTAPVDVKPELPVVSEAKPEPPSPLPEVKPQPAAIETKPQPAATEMKSQPPPTETKPQPTPTPPPLQLPVGTTPQPNASDSTVKPTADQKQPTEECKVVAIPSPPILPPSTLLKMRQPLERPQVQSEPIPLPPPDSPSSEQPVKTSDTSKDDGKQKKGVFTKLLEMVGVKEKNGSEETKSVFYDVEAGGESGVKEVAKQTEGNQPEMKEVEMKEPETVQYIAKPEESLKDQQSIQVVDAKRKSPSPKLTMPQTPETAITTPTPPPNQDIPPMKNPALLKVEETILETPPVPEPSNIQTEIEGIIGKAKTEVESLLEKGTSDVVNTMKLITGEDQEEVEELKVTSEEERKRHKGEVVSSKLSDQILKAIPPPRRKAISEATASTSAIPKATPDSKSPQPAEGKTKSTKPSSIPVPPPRNKGKPQPPPSKGKGKK